MDFSCYMELLELDFGKIRIRAKHVATVVVQYWMCPLSSSFWHQPFGPLASLFSKTQLEHHHVWYEKPNLVIKTIHQTSSKHHLSGKTSAMEDLPEIQNSDLPQGGNVSHRSRPATPFGVPGAPEVSYPAGKMWEGHPPVTSAPKKKCVLKA